MYQVVEGHTGGGGVCAVVDLDDCKGAGDNKVK